MSAGVHERCCANERFGECWASGWVQRTRGRVRAEVLDGSGAQSEGGRYEERTDGDKEVRDEQVVHGERLLAMCGGA